MKNYERLQKSILVSNYLPDVYAMHNAYNSNYVNGYDLNPYANGRVLDVYGAGYGYAVPVSSRHLQPVAIDDEYLNINIKASAPPPPYVKH